LRSGSGLATGRAIAANVAFATDIAHPIVMLSAIVRRVLPRDHYVFLSWARDEFGSSTAIAAYARMILTRGRHVRVPVPGSKRHHVYLRPGSVDQFVYNQVLQRREYEFDCGNPSLIVDAGAHIGLASVFFALRFPNARIMALEPESSNFETLLINVAPFPQVVPVNAALWGERTVVGVGNPTDSTWSFRVEAGESANVDAITVSDLIEDGARIGLLKMDIEGAEVEVLSSSSKWMDRIDALAIELHDRFRPGCTAALNSAIGEHDFVPSAAGELLLFRRR
jgi:FkbM family methyltransferase